MDKTEVFEHLVQFYRDEEALMSLFASYFKIGIGNGESFIVIATPEHLHEFRTHLDLLIDVDKAIATKKYIPLDALETLKQFMVKGMPDAKKFSAVIGSLLDRTTVHGARIRAYGEMVALLWNKGNEKAAIKLEKLWNGLAKTRDFSLLCSYPLNGLVGSDEAMLLPEICTLHSHVVTTKKILA